MVYLEIVYRGLVNPGASRPPNARARGRGEGRGQAESSDGFPNPCFAVPPRLASQPVGYRCLLGWRNSLQATLGPVEDQVQSGVLKKNGVSHARARGDKAGAKQNRPTAWGTAREVLRVLSAPAIVVMAALPRAVDPKTKERVWSDLCASWSLTAIPCGMLLVDLRCAVAHGPSSLLGSETAREVRRVLSAYGHPRCFGSKGARKRLWSDLYPSWSLKAIPCRR